ncbi:MAG: hypothetical protein NZ108_01995 [Bacteroidia bacterium]|nr:hypothetical protein [Bacteroidia bacterium]
MKQFLITLLLVITNWIIGYSQGERMAGADIIGMGGAYTALNKNVWAQFVNPAGISGIQAPVFGLYAEQRFLLAELNFGGFAGAIPFAEKQVAGISASSLGGEHYRFTKAGFTYAGTFFERFHPGIRLNMIHLAVPNYGTATGFWLDVGAQAEILKGLRAGFRASNASRTKFADEQLPVILSGGLAYVPSKTVSLDFDIEKHEWFPVNYRAGIQYQPADFLVMRTGIQTYPISYHAGIGIKLKGILLDLAGSYHNQLGFSPSISCGYQFAEKEVSSNKD